MSKDDCTTITGGLETAAINYVVTWDGTDYSISIPMTTMTGQQIARNSLQFVDGVFYFPFDLGYVVNRTLRLVKPRLFIMMETEIWPNLLRACKRAGVVFVRHDA